MNATMNISPTNFTAKEAIKNDLRRGIVQVVYAKLNGEVNNRKATLNFDLIPEKDHPKGDEKKAATQDEGYVRYYDLTKGEWRQFHVDRLKECNVLFELEPVNEEYEFHTLKFKKLTYEALKQVAEEVVRQEEHLTTLGLKQELRIRGYWAEQAHVSQLMTTMFEQEGGWHYHEHPSEEFRHYFLRELKV